MSIVPNDMEYRKYFHVDRNSFVVVLEYLRIEDFFAFKRSGCGGRPVSVNEESVLMAIISYYATSLSLLQCSFNAGINCNIILGISVTTLYSYLQRFIELMIDIWHQIIFIPTNIDELSDMTYIFNRESFTFEGAKLAIDGTLIRKQINYTEGSTYFDRKGNTSINGMFVFDTNCNIRNIFINKPGSTNDKRVYGESWLAQNIEIILPNNTFMLGDGGYTLSSKMMIPYNAIQLRNDDNGFRKVYNKIQSSARMAAERGIGKLKQRFKKLMNGLPIYKAGNSVKFIISAAIFHQILLNIEDGYAEYNAMDSEEQVYDEGSEHENIDDRHSYRNKIAESLFRKHIRSITLSN